MYMYLFLINWVSGGGKAQLIYSGGFVHQCQTDLVTRAMGIRCRLVTQANKSVVDFKPMMLTTFPDPHYHSTTLVYMYLFKFPILKIKT